MEKYHELIISLIKSHRKYPEYESILEDIAALTAERHSRTISQNMETMMTELIALL